MAITDHGVAQAFPEAMHAIERNGIDLKILYGVEAYYVNDSGNVSVVKGKYDAPLDETFVCFDTRDHRSQAGRGRNDGNCGGTRYAMARY